MGELFVSCGRIPSLFFAMLFVIENINILEYVKTSVIVCAVKVHESDPPKLV